MSLSLCVATFVLLGKWGPVQACPRFSEFFPDPVDVPDQQGEFVEIRLEESGTLAGAFADTLLVQFEDKAPLRFAYAGLRGLKRLLLVHDSTGCGSFPFNENMACGSLGKLSLPNSRESLWRLSAGGCSDSVLLPVPKAGRALQRVKESEDWEVAEPTPGYANPYYEMGVSDCGISLGRNGREILLSGCDSLTLRISVVELFSGRRLTDSLFLRGSIKMDGVLDSVAGKTSVSGSVAYILHAELPRDEAPSNDLIDTLLLEGSAPVALSEIHHCPAEPEPEWVEVYNRSSVPLPLSRFSFCNRGGPWSVSRTPKSEDSIAPYESILFTKDSLLLREFMGFREVRIFQLPMGYLNNSAGSISICMGETVVDSAVWDKSTVACPAGFNPRTGIVENTPGFQGRRENQGRPDAEKEEVPFFYKLSSRVLRRGKTPLRVYVESESEVILRLLDSAGRESYRRTVPAQSSAWWDIPLVDLPSVGIAYVEMSVGKFVKLVGILLRP